MALDSEREPMRALVDWANRYPLVSGVHLPWDRPWFHCTGALGWTEEGYWVECICGTMVLMHRCRAADGWLYIGQCACGGERVIWTYRDH